MSQYIHLSTEPGEDDALVQVKRYFVTVLKGKDKEAAEKFESEFAELYSEGCDFQFILQLFFRHINKVIEQPDEKSREIEGCFSLLISLLPFLDEEEKMVGLCEEMSEILILASNHPNTRLKLLMCLYNVFTPQFAPRYPIFKKILTFAFENKLYDQLHPYLAQLEEWKRDWDLPREEESALYFMIQIQLRSLGRQEKAYQFLQKYLRLYEQAAAKELSSKECEEGALLAIKDACALPKVFEVDSIMSLAAVKSLAPKHRKLMELMDIFLKEGNPQKLAQFRTANPKVFADYGIDYDALLEKIRLLSLASLAKDKQEIFLADAAAQLGESVEEIEKWVVKAIAEGVIEGRVDQLAKSVKVKSTLFRTFGQNEWANLERQVRHWLDNISVLKGLVAQQSGFAANSGLAMAAAAVAQ